MGLDPRSKYRRTIRDLDDPTKVITVDVYRVCTAFAVTCPATAHAIKKLLCAGLRGKGDKLQDLEEVHSAVEGATREEQCAQAEQRENEQRQFKATSPPAA